jgi:hypothetical protein
MTHGFCGFIDVVVSDAVDFRKRVLECHRAAAAVVEHADELEDRALPGHRQQIAARAIEDVLLGADGDGSHGREHRLIGRRGRRIQVHRRVLELGVGAGGVQADVEPPHLAVEIADVGL